MGINHKVSRNAVLCIIILLPPSWTQMYFSAPYFRTPSALVPPLMCHAQFRTEKGIGYVLWGLNQCLSTDWLAKVSWCYAFGTKSYYIDNCIKSSIFCKSNRSDVVTTLAWALCCINKTQIFDQQGRRIITGSARHTNSPLPYFSYGWEHFRILRNTS